MTIEYLSYDWIFVVLSFQERGNNVSSLVKHSPQQQYYNPLCPEKGILLENLHKGTLHGPKMFKGWTSGEEAPRTSQTQVHFGDKPEELAAIGHEIEGS